MVIGSRTHEQRKIVSTKKCAPSKIQGGNVMKKFQNIFCGNLAIFTPNNGICDRLFLFQLLFFFAQK
jgi:hypothetical protein